MDSHAQIRQPRAAPGAFRGTLALLALLLGSVLAPHAQAAPAGRTQFDHLTTGFELLGQHRDLPCESCHVNAIVKGTPRLCASCHGVGTEIRATAKPNNHIMSTDQCEACHTPVAWRPAVNFDHTQTLGSCSTCHNGAQAQGKPPNHILTNLECDVCHTTLSWSGATFSHEGVTGNCASCHNGVNADGMTPNHIPIGSPPTPCESCHSPTNFTTWAGAQINHPAVTAMQCAACHETANFLGMHASTNTTAGDSRPNATLDANHPKSGDCGQCHATVSFAASAALKPAKHIPTNAACAQCHTTVGNYAVYSVTGTHQGVTGCLSCHGAGAGPFAGPPPSNTIAIVGWPGNSHIPIGTLDCNGSGCHSTGNVNAGGFKLGTASINAPTLNATGHTTVATAVTACETCHQSAQFLGMMVGASMKAQGDERPTKYDSGHPSSGDCGSCHTTTPTFASDLNGGAGKPTNHIPTSAPCTQCHTTSGNYAVYSVTGTHQGVTGCLSCHGAGTGPFAGPPPSNAITIVGWPGNNHIPVGSLDCNGSGCHSTTNVNAGGFKLGTASINTPTLNATGHTTVATAVTACQTCHQNAQFLGMIGGTNTTAGDSRPTTALDKSHPTTGDCGSCHTTTPTFASDITGGGKPANHIPTNAPCTQCHTTSGNYAVYSVTGTHQGVTSCLACHGEVTGPFAGPPPSNSMTIVGWPGNNHIPIGSLDCNGSGCHSTTNVNSGGFKLGTASINTPTLNATGHTTVATAVTACQTCHQDAQFLGMIGGTNTTAGDSRPTTALDKSHPTTGDCGSCHTTTPTFASDITGGGKPANHIPTSAPCSQCHTTAGNYAAYSVTGTHQGVTNCLSCHGSSVATTFANVTIVTNPSNHIPIGSLDCNGSGCHSTSNVNPGGFKLGTASINTPTLAVAGHTTVAGAVSGCQTCHQSAQFLGMVAGTNTTAGDSRPTATLDKSHPTTGDCNGCHTTTPTFASDQTGSTKPANHIPTSAPCAQCHTTAGNYAVYSVTGTHQGVTGCLTCHGSSV